MQRLGYMAEHTPNDDPTDPDCEAYEPLLGDDIEREVFNEQVAERTDTLRAAMKESGERAEAEFQDRVAAKRRARLHLVN